MDKLLVPLVMRVEDRRLLVVLSEQDKEMCCVQPTI